jgi:hypothetical protein
MEDNLKLFDYKLTKLDKNKDKTEYSLNLKEDLFAQESVITEKLRNEIMYKDMIIEELKSKIEGLFLQEDDLKIRRIEDDNLRLSRTNEKLMNENIQLKKTLKQLEDENNLHTIRTNDLEIEKKENDKKIWSDELELKSLKKEYEIVFKKLNSLTKQMNIMNSKVEDLKAENETINKENSLLKQKLNINTKTTPAKSSNLSSLSFSTTLPSELSSCNFYSNNGNTSQKNLNSLAPKKSQLPIENNKNSIEDDIYYPSEKKLKDAKNEILFLEEKLSSLLNEKKSIENELFKQSDKSRTIVEINKKRKLEEGLKDCENSINEIRTRMRQLNLNK